MRRGTVWVRDLCFIKIVAALNNNKTMLFYWLNKQKELFAKDETYVAALFYEI